MKQQELWKCPAFCSDFLHAWSCHLWTNTVLRLSSQSVHLLFPFLIALAKTSSMLKKSGERRHPSFIPDFSWKTSSFSPVSMKLAVCYLVTSLYQLKFPSIPSLLRIPIMNGCWSLWNVFSAFIYMIMWFFSFSLLMWWITLINFQMFNRAFILGIHPTWLWYIFLYCFGFDLLTLCLILPLICVWIVQEHYIYINLVNIQGIKLWFTKYLQFSSFF